MVLTKDDDIVQVHRSECLGILIENNVECTLKCRWGVHKPKGHLVEPTCSRVAGEAGFFLRVFCREHLLKAPAGGKCQNQHCIFWVFNALVFLRQQSCILMVHCL